MAALIVQIAQTLCFVRASNKIDDALWWSTYAGDLWWRFFAEVSLRHCFEIGHRKIKAAKDIRSAAVEKTKQRDAVLQAELDHVFRDAAAKGKQLATIRDALEHIRKYKPSALGNRDIKTLGRKKFKKTVIHERE